VSLSLNLWFFGGRLASAAGIGRVTLVRIENGEQAPRFETSLKLAGSLGPEPH